MGRRLFNLFTALSLLLLVVVGILWIRNVFGQGDLLEMQYAHDPSPDKHYVYSFKISSHWNTLRFGFDRDYLDPPFFQNRPAEWIRDFRASWKAGFHIWVANDFVKRILDWELPGFDAEHFAGKITAGEYDESWVLAVRPWLPMLLLVVLPAVWTYRWFRGRRVKRPGLCPACGYDLRATPQRCPECGRTAAESA